jgi:hypothetical protein
MLSPLRQRIFNLKTRRIKRGNYMSYYRVVSGSECYGIAGTRADAQKIIDMHKFCIKGAGVGGKAAEGGKAAACASKTFSIEEVQGDYPRK